LVQHKEINLTQIPEWVSTLDEIDLVPDEPNEYLAISIVLAIVIVFSYFGDGSGRERRL
jgi:hypothetical protein